MRKQRKTLSEKKDLLTQRSEVSLRHTLPISLYQCLLWEGRHDIFIFSDHV